MTKLVESEAVQDLLDRASGVKEAEGNPRAKAIIRDLLEGLMTTLEKHDVDESEFWQAVDFMGKATPEFGLIAPGLGIEHFLDLLMDARDEAEGITGGTPRTIEGPLYVSGAPLVEGNPCLTDDNDDGETLTMSGTLRGPDGEPVKNAILHVWHANSKGFYSHFDPTGEQTAFNNRRRIKVNEDGTYQFHSTMPNGYSVPPGGSADTLMKLLGRHGNRPAHVHFLAEAPGYRVLTTQINFGDDPFARDDFAFGTREGLMPVPDRRDNKSTVAFDFSLTRSTSADDERLSTRPRAAA